jgi:hypothetical protein
MVAGLSSIAVGFTVCVDCYEWGCYFGCYKQICYLWTTYGLV